MTSKRGVLGTHFKRGDELLCVSLPRHFLNLREEGGRREEGGEREKGGRWREREPDTNQHWELRGRHTRTSSIVASSFP